MAAREKRIVIVSRDNVNVSKGSEGAASKKRRVRIEFSNSLRSLSSTHRPAPNRVQVLEKKKKVRLASRLRDTRLELQLLNSFRGLAFLPLKTRTFAIIFWAVSRIKVIQFPSQTKTLPATRSANVYRVRMHSSVLGETSQHVPPNLLGISCT